MRERVSNPPFAIIMCAERHKKILLGYFRAVLGNFSELAPRSGTARAVLRNGGREC